ncbi:MAG: hypothetical protein ACLTB5_15480 [Acutalibacteraceae bacterium]
MPSTKAHSGDTVSDMLLHYDDWVGRFHPSVVSIMPEFEGEKSGLNVQARFEHDLSALISRAKSDGALVILQNAVDPAERFERLPCHDEDPWAAGGCDIA